MTIVLFIDKSNNSTMSEKANALAGMSLAIFIGKLDTLAEQGKRIKRRIRKNKRPSEELVNEALEWADQVEKSSKTANAIVHLIEKQNELRTEGTNDDQQVG